ncbi:MAG: YceD family protein [Micrococcales bacterium]
MAKSVYTVNVHDLMHKAGQMRVHRLELDLPEAMGNGIAAIPVGEEMDVDLRLESVHEGILATGEVFSEAKAECSRCLDPVTIPVEVDFQELFAYSLTNEDDFAIEDENIDLEQVILDAVVLSLPFQPICKKDCLGLCADCGERLADNPHHVHEAAVDPRWNELKKLKED